MDQIIQFQKWVGQKVWRQTLSQLLNVLESRWVEALYDKKLIRLPTPNPNKISWSEKILKWNPGISGSIKLHRNVERFVKLKTFVIKHETGSTRSDKQASTQAAWAVGTGTKSSTWDGNYCTLYGYNSIIARSWIQFFARLCVVHLFH